MADHGLLFSISDDDGPKVQVPLGDVELLAQLLGEAPGGKEGSPTAFEAQRILELALARRDEVRHWVLTDQAAGEILWTISRRWADNPIPEGLRALRDALTDYDGRKDES